MKVYYARSPNESGEKETVEHHLRRTGELCSKFLSQIGYEDWGEVLGQTHDMGKISGLFQERLDNKTSRVNHAIPGAAFAQEADRICTKYRYLVPLIYSHHSDYLENMGSCSGVLKRSVKGDGERFDSSNAMISIFGEDEFKNAIAYWNRFFSLKRLKAAPNFSSSEDNYLSKMLFCRLLFSALIDADWSSSAEHFDCDYLKKHTGTPLNAEKALSQLIDVRESKRKNSTASSSLNKLRNELFDSCLEAGSEAPGLFTLTAPTGLGKTLSLLAFSLNHCICHNKRRIILLLPYLSIIEQNCKDYRQIIPEMLEIHSDVHWSDEARAESERWDSPCIVTTNVGFFEPLFSAQPKKCRHLHQIANSVIVLDEAQTLPPKLLDATLRTLKDLCEYYGCTVVLSTATQPSYQFRPRLCWNPREIAPNPPALFEATKRVQWNWCTQKAISFAEIANELSQYEQFAVIVNLKDQANELFDELSRIFPEESLFYMTTDLCPAHRSAVLEQIRERIKNNLPCRLVATQCIEAGVDLDFPVVYRALAPLDSIIQAAGRCNRNGDSPNGIFKIFVPEDERYPDKEYQKAALQVKTLLSRHEIDGNNLEHISEYYSLLYESTDGDKKSLQNAIAAEDYKKVEEEYKMIDKSGVPVIVPYSDKIDLFNKLRDSYDHDGLTAGLLAMAKELTVTSLNRKAIEAYCVPLYFRKNKAERATAYMLEIPLFYDDKKGLNFSVPFNGII